MTEAEFDTICRLGQGTYGEVYKVKRKSDGKEYALKKVKLLKQKEKDKRNTLNEVRILASVDHPNIIQYKQAIFDENKGQLALIMQLAEGGDLAAKIKNRFQKAETFREEQIWKWGTQILEGLKCLHSLGVVHRDIKPANILFTLDGTPQIGDLNVARELIGGLAYSQTGTPNYASPEIWDNLSYGAQCDIWSFGCIMYELCCFRTPFRSKDMDQLYGRVKSCKYDPIPRRYSVGLQNAIDRCLKKRQQRINLEELLRVFSRHTVTHVPKRSHSVGSLLKKIEVPVHIKDVSAILPSARYTKQLILNPEEHNMQVKPSSVLDKFMKEMKPGLARQRRLNNKVYTQQSENILKPCKSQVFIGEKQTKRKQEELKMISFRQVLDSLQNARMGDRLVKMGIKKRNFRYGLKLFQEPK